MCGLPPGLPDPTGISSQYGQGRLHAGQALRFCGNLKQGSRVYELHAVSSCEQMFLSVLQDGQVGIYRFVFAFRLAFCSRLHCSGDPLIGPDEGCVLWKHWKRTDEYVDYVFVMGTLEVRRDGGRLKSIEAVSCGAAAPAPAPAPAAALHLIPAHADYL
jgi:hypothetical protein